ncbi:nucleotidyl transferase AbiEii/AbiGii toxin family protein [Ciceribacter azotifigens]|uniref:nucleotidyl transferase AbiEii/AbiGii toxin family protein n=1 Tax=Ciceribacter azotifigens TaxID=2069303 RepID=UPI003A864AFC
MNGDLLLSCRCFFGGGTAIVLKNGEYRQSLDLDFLCADLDGYRRLRNVFFEQGIGAVFPAEVKPLREIQADGYGIRTLLEHKGQRIRFEIVRVARIDLSGSVDPVLLVPILSVEDMFAEKLLANADRCFDRAVCYRDAIDLGRLVETHHRIPAVAVEKAERAYGADIARKMAGVLNLLLDRGLVKAVARELDMSDDAAIFAVSSLRLEALRIWPDAGIQIEQGSAGHALEERNNA